MLSLYELYFKEEAVDIAVFEVARELTEEGLEFVDGKLLLAIEEDVEEVMNKVESVYLNIVDDLLNGIREVSVLDLVALATSPLHENVTLLLCEVSTAEPN